MNIAAAARPVSASEPRVLVVDDEPAIRALVAKIVERAGLPVDSARDGADALEKLDEHPYSVIVLDLMMPNVDGFAFIEMLRQRPLPRPAIIVVSAGEPGALRQLDPTLVHSIVRKPFDIDVLGDLISAAATSLREAAKADAAEESEGEGDILQFPSAC